MGTYATDIALHIQNDISFKFLVAAMLVITNNWKQSKTAPAGNLLNSVEYYAAVKKQSKEVLRVLTQLRDK